MYFWGIPTLIEVSERSTILFWLVLRKKERTMKMVGCQIRSNESQRKRDKKRKEKSSTQTTKLIFSLNMSRFSTSFLFRRRAHYDSNLDIDWAQALLGGMVHNCQSIETMGDHPLLVELNSLITLQICSALYSSMMSWSIKILLTHSKYKVTWLECRVFPPRLTRVSSINMEISPFVELYELIIWVSLDSRIFVRIWESQGLQWSNDR